MLGLGSSLYKAGKVGKSIIRDGLVLKHDYNAGAVEPCSTGAADINADGDSNEYIDVGPITIGTGDVSLSAWVNVSTFVNLGGIISNRQTASTYPGLEIRTRDSSKIEIAIDDGGSNTESISDTLNTNQWYHVCAVFDRSDKQFLYIDGVLVDSDDITSENLTLNHSDSVLIGRRDNTGYDFQGYICNVGYWNAALTQPQIKSIMHKDYAGLSASEKTGLSSWWNLDSTLTDTTVLDNHYGGGSELGSELWDSPASTDGSISSWVKYGNNDIATVNGAVQITYKDHVAGAYVYLKNSTVLSTDLTVGAVYKIIYDVKVNSGSSVLPQVVQSGSLPNVSAGAVTSTEFITQEIYFVAGHATNVYLKVEFMGTDEIATLDNFSLKLVNGNTGTLA